MLTVHVSYSVIDNSRLVPRLSCANITWEATNTKFHCVREARRRVGVFMKPLCAYIKCDVCNCTCSSSCLRHYCTWHLYTPSQSSHCTETTVCITVVSQVIYFPPSVFGHNKKQHWEEKPRMRLEKPSVLVNSTHHNKASLC